MRWSNQTRRCRQCCEFVPRAAARCPWCFGAIVTEPAAQQESPTTSTQAIKQTEVEFA